MSAFVKPSGGVIRRMLSAGEKADRRMLISVFSLSLSAIFPSTKDDSLDAQWKGERKGHMVCRMLITDVKREKRETDPFLRFTGCLPVPRRTKRREREAVALGIPWVLDAREEGIPLGISLFSLSFSPLLLSAKDDLPDAQWEEKSKGQMICLVLITDRKKEKRETAPVLRFT